MMYLLFIYWRLMAAPPTAQNPRQTSTQRKKQDLMKKSRMSPSAWQPHPLPLLYPPDWITSPLTITELTSNLGRSEKMANCTSTVMHTPATLERQRQNHCHLCDHTSVKSSSSVSSSEEDPSFSISADNRSDTCKKITFRHWTPKAKRLKTIFLRHFRGLSCFSY